MLHLSSLTKLNGLVTILFFLITLPEQSAS